MRSIHPSERTVPDGIIAALLAIAIAVAGAWTVQRHGVDVARRHLRALAQASTGIKSLHLTYQRAAFGRPDVLPIYGSSELFCCGSPYRAPQLFARAPTGFDVFAVGGLGTADLFFMETFGALGRALDGKRVVISVSPGWTFGRDGLPATAYAANFSPEIAYGFVFSAPIPLALRQAGARRMLAYPETLREEPVLRAGVRSLASGTPLALAEYAALSPLGRLRAWVLEVQGAVDTSHFIDRHRWVRADPPARPRPLDWVHLARHATSITERRDTTNPFAFPNAAFRRQLRKGRIAASALELHRAGRNNHDGDVLPRDRRWEAEMAHSAAWTDLRLELGVLRELGARPLVLSPPLNGAYDDYTPMSLRERRKYYRRYETVVERAGVPWVDFRSHDEDRDFLTDPGSHLSPRGWIFADRAIDMFWHDEPMGDVRTAVATLENEAPGPSGARPR